MLHAAEGGGLDQPRVRELMIRRVKDEHLIAGLIRVGDVQEEYPVNVHRHIIWCLECS